MYCVSFSQFPEIIQMKKVLVTGGAGFVGSFLCDRLIDEGHEVIAIDNFFTGNKANLRQLQNNPNFELMRHDIVEPVLLEVDWIFNLACPASPVHYQYNPIKTAKTNVIGTLNMLGLALRVNARILQASTSEVYGNPQVHPQPEGYFGHVNPIGLRSCYDEGKRVAETLTMDYHRQNQVDAKIVRIFNTYGPRMRIDDGRAVPNFMFQALKGDDITVYGDGSQTRSLCYVDDTVEAIYRLASYSNLSSANRNGFENIPDPIVVNIGNPVEMTVLDIAKSIKDISDSKGMFNCNIQTFNILKNFYQINAAVDLTQFTGSDNIGKYLLSEFKNILIPNITFDIEILPINIYLNIDEKSFGNILDNPLVTPKLIKSLEKQMEVIFVDLESKADFVLEIEIDTKQRGESYSLYTSVAEMSVYLKN